MPQLADDDGQGSDAVEPTGRHDMDAIARLEAIEDIRQLKGRYFFHMDSKDWAAWREVFTDDIEMDVSAHFPGAPDPSLHIYRGVDTVVATVSGSVGPIVTVHHGHTPLITIESDEAASGIWAMEDNLIMPDGSRMLGYGHYYEEYRKVGGAWKIARTRLARLKVLQVRV